MKNRKTITRILAAALAAFTALAAAPAAMAEPDSLPYVSPEMTRADAWKRDGADEVLADRETIAAVNAATLACADCRMTDMTAEVPAWDGTDFQRRLLSGAMRELGAYLDPGYYDRGGQGVPYAELTAVLDTIDAADTAAEENVRYGICVALTNVRAAPTDAIITDAAGDNDFDVLQMSYIRVNEPVLIRAQTADGAWFYCDTSCVSGWVRAADIAVCADREQWLAAWQIPDDELLVVTEGKLYLDQSNVNAAASQRMLTMGTVLRRVPDEAFDPAVTNRAVYQNYAVYLPTRTSDGSYAVTIALIPQHCGVSEGYLPLTASNILDTAFSMLGDAYGWGGMLAVPDCSLYVRNVYKCFGLELPRNTTWQSAMPAQKFALTELDASEKAALLDTLPVGAILFFSGHEMLYLGEMNGRHYVISTVSSIMEPDSDRRLRVRSVVINTLEDTRRANGRTWLEDLNLASIPSQLSDGAQTPSRLALAYRELIVNSVPGDTITIHAQGDPDTIAAAMAGAELFGALGLDAELVLDSPLNDAARYLFESFGLEAPTAAGESEAPGAEADAAPVCAASTLTYLRFQNCEVPISRETARMLLAGILSRTEGFSAACADMDRLAFRELEKLAEIEDTDALWQGMTQAGTETVEAEAAEMETAEMEPAA